MSPGNQLHLVVLKRTEIENHLPRFLNRKFELLFAFSQGRQAGFGIFADQLLGQFQLETTPARLWTSPS